MKNFGLVLCLLTGLLALTSPAGIWPFSSDKPTGEEAPRRLSELLEPATALIDEASDLAAEGKATDAVDAYRKALVELDRIERENPERAASAEFASVRNKRAYVNAAIDSILMSQVQENARPVAVSDTTALEEKLAAEKRQKQRELRQQIIHDLSAGDLTAATSGVEKLLKMNPKSRAALNLRAAIETQRGEYAKAAETLRRILAEDPDDAAARANLKALRAVLQ